MKGNKWRTGLLLFVLSIVLAVFAWPERAAAAEGTSDDFGIRFEDRAAVTEAAYYYVMYIPTEFNQGERITVTDQGKTREFTYRFNDFYDKNWKSIGDYGFGVMYRWVDDTGLNDPDSIVGRTFTYLFGLYRTDEDGNPLDAEGKPAEGIDDISFCATTEVLSIRAMDDHIEKTVNGILYYVYHGEETANVILGDMKLSGTIEIRKNIRIGGKTYPVTKISNGAFSGRKKITAVKLPDTITEIGAGAFANSGLKQIAVPAAVEAIGDTAFGINQVLDQKTQQVITTKVPGFVIYARAYSAAAEYASDNDLTLISEISARQFGTQWKKTESLKGKKVRLKWKKVKNASGYQIYWRAGKSGSYKKAVTIKNNGTIQWTSKKLTGVKKGQTTSWKIRPYTRVAGTTVYGKWSAVKTLVIR